MGSFFDDYEIIAASGLFDVDYYIAANPDVAALNLDPLMHYLEQGAREMRNPSEAFDAKAYSAQFGGALENPLLHFIASASASEPPIERDIVMGLDSATIDEASPTRRVTGLGWLVAKDSIVELRAEIGGTSVVAQYGLSRSDVAKTFPQFERAEQSGFTFVFDGLPAQSTQGPVDIVFTIRTADGRAHRSEVQTYLVPVAAESPSALIEVEAELAYRGLPPMKLEIDTYTLDEAGILRIVGWAGCFAPIVTIQVFIDDERLGAADYGRSRNDVALAFPDYPNAGRSGFGFISDIGRFGAGRKTIRVQAIATTGISREVAFAIDAAPVTSSASSVFASKIDVFCDSIDLVTDGSLTIEGWALATSGAQQIIIELDGEVLGEAQAGLERPDVGHLFPANPKARSSGFSFQTRIGKSVSEGEHMIVLRVRSADAETEIPMPVLARQAAARLSAAKPTQVVGGSELRLNIDLPLLVGGAAASPVRDNLQIAGWALARAGIEKIDIAIDGEFLTSAFTGIRRLDVQAQFADWPDALTSGFTALLPHRVLATGARVLSVTLTDKAGNVARTEFSIEVETAAETIGPWSLRRRSSISETGIVARLIQSLRWQPAFWVAFALPSADETQIALARRTLMSLDAQTYGNHHILILPPAKADKAALLASLLADFPRLAGRVCFLEKKTRLRDVADAADYFIAVLPGDEFGCNALAEFVVEAGFQRDADFIYADDRRIGPTSEDIAAYFKPDWSPDLLLSTNYVGRAWCAKVALVDGLGENLDATLTAGAYDLALRLTEKSTLIHHVPAVLFEQVGHRADPALDRLALERALNRRKIDGQIEAGAAPGIFRVKRPVKTNGLVSIVIPTRATRGLIKVCLDTLKTLTAYPHYEIVCIENIPADQQDWKVWLRANADTVIEAVEPFNWSRFNNLAVAQAKGEFLLFLNDDIEITEPDWLDVLLEQAQRPEVGAVGPRLVYPDRRVQHAGMFLAEMGIARHAFRYLAEDDPGYFGLALTQRNVIAVTGACLMTRRETFEALGRFDENHTIVNNDLDYCLRVWRTGLRTLYTPHATLIHHEQASRNEMADIYDAKQFDSQWRGLFVAGDPYFNPRLSKGRDDYSYEWEPLELTFAGRPVFAPEAIEKILIVKLDHIGDCVIALPAIRRLKRAFPHAKLSVLSSRASRSIWALEPAIEEIIEFDFFFARSSLGMLELGEDDWRALEDRLAPHRFDLAIDLRKHLETRPVLRHAGAKYLAGYDYKAKFPWLHIALEWSEDLASFRKRQHTGDDLNNLVDAVIAAGATDPALLAPAPKTKPNVKGLGPFFAKPVVCIHPTAGNEMKQWPPLFFARLIDQLVASEDANVAIVGGPEDAGTADAIMAAVGNPQAVKSFVGKLTLDALPGFMAQCALFVGNDSGPKHLAAALGIATVGIHSGTVDVREWGPLGAMAVGISRDMTCAPCYRSKIEDCHRGLACMTQILPGEVYAVCKRLLVAVR